MTNPLERALDRIGEKHGIEPPLREMPTTKDLDPWWHDQGPNEEEDYPE